MDKNSIIYNMCLTYRHDYGLDKRDEDPPWVAGMTTSEREGLWKTMEQIYNNCIEPLLSEAKEINDGHRVVIPKSKEHAEYMVKAGMFYLEKNNAESK